MRFELSGDVVSLWDGAVRPTAEEGAGRSEADRNGRSLTAGHEITAVVQLVDGLRVRTKPPGGGRYA
jgi:hypothetical protein